MKKLIFASVLFFLYVNVLHAQKAHSSNPLLTPSTLPLQAPRFDLIKNEDYQPAFMEGMKQQLLEVDAIANNHEKATFDNTIGALEESGQLLGRVSKTFDLVVQANTNNTLDQVQTAMAPKLAAHQDAIFLNPELFARVKRLYFMRDQLKLSTEQQQLLEVYYDRFVHSGANLNNRDKKKLQEINKQLASLQTEFRLKLIAAANAGELILHDKKQLTGLSDEDIAAITHIKDKRTQYVISLQNTTQQPFLSSLANRDTREKLFMHSWNRAEKNDKNDTRKIISKIAALRVEQAKLLDYVDYASYQLYDQMAKTPDAVQLFLSRLISPTSEKIKSEAKILQTEIDNSSHFDLRAWDWDFYSEKVRKAKFNFDEAQVKPYFELNRVLIDGVFYAANQLYGVTFKERHDIPVYQPDVRVFDVYDKDGSVLGMLYLDLFKRDNKSGGAWMSNLVVQSKLLYAKPVVYNVTNFTKPPAGMPALLTFDDVRTMFHEFGHALHGLFSNVVYPSSGDTARDFVEFPSQFNEHWALYPAVLKNYAMHYQTHEPIPAELVDKIIQSGTFNQGYSLGELLAAAELDMQWHELTSSATIKNVDEFELQALKNTHTDFQNVPPRYRSSYFLHIWANGYPASYYAYLWTEMLDDDAYDWFMKHGGMTRENGDRFRDMILSRGHTEDYDKMFKAFYGAEPTIEPMLAHRGIT